MAYNGPELDDVGNEEDELRRKAAIPPPPPIGRQAIDTESSPVGTTLQEPSFTQAPPIGQAPQSTETASDETPSLGRSAPAAYEQRPHASLPKSSTAELRGIATTPISRRSLEPSPGGAPAGFPEAPPISSAPQVATVGGGEAPPIQAPGFAERYRGLQAERPVRGAPEYAVPMWKKGLGAGLAAIASGFSPTHPDAGAIYRGIAEGPYNRAEQTWEQKERGLEEEARLADTDAQMRQRDEQAELERQKAKQPAKRQYENIQQLHADAVQDAISRGVDPAEDRKVLQIEDSMQRIQKESAPRGHTNPFEAFTYGTPEEKKAAQDFLQFEKRMDRQNQKPTEAEFRYSLYLRDPETYKALYGDKGEAATERTRVADRAHATTMLKYFDKRRDEISKDYTLGDDEKKQKLAEIDELEKPYKDAATAGGKDTDRVNVIGPDGTPGTVPRAQLERAKKKGYREAAQ